MTLAECHALAYPWFGAIECKPVSTGDTVCLLLIPIGEGRNVTALKTPLPNQSGVAALLPRTEGGARLLSRAFTA